MTKHASRILRNTVCRLPLIAFCFLLGSCQAAVVVHEVRSDFSQIQVVDYGSRRALLFAGESGHQAVETLIDLNEPHRLQHPYARTMMAASLLYRPDASACLLVGLGGGAIVRFLNHHFPELSLDVVEIDPVVVRVSREYFGTVPDPRTRILVEDGFAYLQRTRDRYDLILMDVHLHPGEQTDRSGQPLHLKTAAFLRGLHERLRPGGVVLFNMLRGSDTPAYIESVRAAFPATAIFRPVGSGNLIVVAVPSGFLPSDAELRERARALDRLERYGFSVERELDERRN
jgi:spermidine synthase